MITCLIFYIHIYLGSEQTKASSGTPLQPYLSPSPQHHICRSQISIHQHNTRRPGFFVDLKHLPCVALTTKTSKRYPSMLYTIPFKPKSRKPASASEDILMYIYTQHTPTLRSKRCIEDLIVASESMGLNTKP